MTDTTVDAAQPDGASAELGVSPVDTAAPGTANEAASAATLEGTPPAQPEDKPQGRTEHWSNKRLGQYAERLRTSEAGHAEKDRIIADLQRRLQPQGQGDGQQPRTPTRADYDRAVQQGADERAQHMERERADRAWDEAGAKASPTFRQDCATLAHLGAAENPFAVQVLKDLDDSPKVIARLAADPAEAERIFALPPHRAAVAIAQFAAKAPPATPVSRAPAPISPVAGSAKVDGDPSKLSDEEWYRREMAKEK